MSDEEQDYVAAMLLDFANSREAGSHQLTPEQVAVVQLAQKDVEAGLFASDEEMRKRWRRFGLDDAL